MQQHQSELDSLGVRVVVVTFQTALLAQRYDAEGDLPGPVLIDDRRQLYTAYGMERGNWWDIWGFASWMIYAKLLLRGRRLHLPTADVHQLGGDVLIDPDGIVRLHHVGQGPADRPDVRTIIDLVRHSHQSEGSSRNTGVSADRRGDGI